MITCGICDELIDGDSAVVVWDPNEGGGGHFYEPFLDDLRTSWPEAFDHPACFAGQHGIAALLALIHEHETKNRTLAWEVIELRRKLEALEGRRQA